MKKFIPLIIIPFIIWSDVCFSFYLIELNNGSTFTTNHYWKKKSQIKFYFRGGVVGVEKDFVRKIRKSDQVYIEENVIQNTAQKPQAQQSIQKAENTDNDLVDIEYYKKEKQRLEQKLNEAKRRYLNSLESGDKETKYAASKNALKINIQIDQLKKELKEKNKGLLPEWWNE